MSSRAVSPQPEYVVSGCYGHSCGELWRALLAVAVARDEMLAKTPRDIHLPQGIVDYQ